MNPAIAPPKHRQDVRLMAVDTARCRFFDSSITKLPQFLEAGDVLVVNDAATIPASLRGYVNDDPIEIRLAGRSEKDWRAVLFGHGDWRLQTEDREAPPVLHRGNTIAFGPGRDLQATVVQVSAISPRLVDLQFNLEPAALLKSLYAHGTPVQYAYQSQALDLWSLQTVYGSQPWAVEMPSAGRPLTWSIILDLRRRGIEVVHLTLAAGLSSTGDSVLDQALPLPEYYDIPESTVTAIGRARDRGHRVVAIGTTVLRAIEGCVDQHGELLSGTGFTDLRIRPGFVLSIVDGILSGMHHPEESHYRVLERFASPQLLEESWKHAVESGYRCHEFGDLSLWIPLGSR